MDIKHFYDVIYVYGYVALTGGRNFRRAVSEPWKSASFSALGTFDDPDETSSSFQTCKNGRDKSRFLRHAMENEHEYWDKKRWEKSKEG